MIGPRCCLNLQNGYVRAKNIGYSRLTENKAILLLARQLDRAPMETEKITFLQPWYLVLYHQPHVQNGRSYGEQAAG